MIKVTVPATSANMGPGFDCLGIALSLYNNFYFEEIEEGLIIEGCEEKYANENNLIYTSMKKCFDKIGYSYKGIRIAVESDIPESRGLGSSAACILAGITAANEIAGGVLNRDEVLELATDIEGHPDNVTPALIGGMTASIYEYNKVYYSYIKLASGLKFCALIPDFKLSTTEARSVLPAQIPYKDGVFNVGRVSLMISALVNGKFDLIRVAMKDRLHQQYRGQLIRGYKDIVEECERLGCVGVFLIGAGPTIMVVLKEDNEHFAENIRRFLVTLQDSWDAKELRIDYTGVKTAITQI